MKSEKNQYVLLRILIYVVAFPDVKFYEVNIGTDFLALTSDGSLYYESLQDFVDHINFAVLWKNNLKSACEFVLRDRNFAVSFQSPDNIAIIIVGFLQNLEEREWLERIGSRFTVLDIAIYLHSLSSFQVIWFSAIHGNWN